MRTEEINQLIGPVIEGMGFEYVGCEFFPQMSRALLRVYVDCEGGINLDQCAEVDRQISGVLEVENAISGAYVLEVSSPGLDRPLFTQEQYARFIGHKVKVRVHNPIDGQRNFVGKLQQLADEKVVIASESEHWELPFVEIEKAHLVVDFGE